MKKTEIGILLGILVLVSVYLPQSIEAQYIGPSGKKVVCKQDFVLIFKFNGIPACVKPDTSVKLVERGWGKIIELYFNQYFANKDGYLGEVDLFCQTDADCTFNTKSMCGPYCGSGISVNKKTSQWINEWREEYSGLCLIITCRQPVITQIPVCVENACSSDKTLHCDAVCYRVENHGFDKMIEFLEKELESAGFDLSDCECGET